MKLNRCPICHSCFDVMALAQDEATQQLLVKLAKFDTLTGVALLGYLSLFCPAKSQLSAARSLGLVVELEGMFDNWARLALAMEIVVQTMQDKKRNNKDVTQFKNHNYLKKVYDDVPPDAGLTLAPVAGSITPVGATNTSKTRGALEILESMKDA